MKNSLIICTLIIIAALGTGISAKAQDQKKPSERSFANEIVKIKQAQAERARLVEKTKPQTTETAAVPVSNEQQKPVKLAPTEAIKPSSGEMRKTSKPASSKG